MASLCIIPARGGSKRIPKKNIKPFFGKPIIAYAIGTALESGLFDEVMVSTDDVDIRAIALKYGAKVPIMRSVNNSNDKATLADVVDEVLEFYKGIFDIGCCLLPTAVLSTTSQLDQALTLLKNGDFDSVRPIVKFSYPIQRAFSLSEKGQVEWFYQDNEYLRTQDMKPAYHDAGQFYWFKGDVGLRSKNRGAIVIKESETHDIDNEEDWKMAEIKYKLIKAD